MPFDILKFISECPIKLVSGVGSPETGGCWMSALSIYSGAQWSDHPECVCPIIRRLCIALNDMLPNDESRGRVIAGVILEPVGTKSDDPDVMRQRLRLVVDASIRIFLPHAMRSIGLNSIAKDLESLPEIMPSNIDEALRLVKRARDTSSADISEAAIYASASAEAAIYASSDIATAAAYAASYASYATAAADAASYAAASFSYASYAAAREKFCVDHVLPVILKLCKIGSKVPVEPSCTELEMRRATQTALV